jgi:hypothetical protein
MIKSAKYGDKLWVINFDKAIQCRVIRTYAASEKRVKLKVIHKGILGSLHAKFEDCFRTKLSALVYRHKQAEKSFEISARFAFKCRREMIDEDRRVK